MKRTQNIIFIVLLLVIQGITASAETPSFLTEYYSSIFKELSLAASATNENVEKYYYVTNDRSLALSIEHIRSERPESNGLLNNISQYINNELNSKKGAFKEITAKEIYAQIFEDKTKKNILAFAMPGSVDVWTYISSSEDDNNYIESSINLIRMAVNKQRYEMAFKTGNVSMGYWGPEIYGYSKHLIDEDNVSEGMHVLSKHLLTSPFNYEAHVDFMEISSNPKAATNSA